jgi:hypothetical protein
MAQVTSETGAKAMGPWGYGAMERCPSLRHDRKSDPMANRQRNRRGCSTAPRTSPSKPHSQAAGRPVMAS